MRSIGFSSHAIERYGLSCLPLERYGEYIARINELKAEYAGRIDVLLGIEQDYYSPALPDDAFDYVIGSVHYRSFGGDDYIGYDYPRDCTLRNIRGRYAGDFVAYARDYFNLVEECVKRWGADIVGHFDIIGIFNDDSRAFDESDPRYQDIAVAALRRIAADGRIFEINTGGMSRGYLSRPYPARFLLEELASIGGKIILSSDSHHADTLDYGFDAAAKLAKECGFKSAMLLTAAGWEEAPI